MRYLKRMTVLALSTCAVALLAGPANAQNKQLTIAMITHAQPGDTFWDIIRKGANAAAKKDNVKLIYLADPTADKEAQLIQNVIDQHVDGIALTLAFPDAEAPAVKAAQAAGIPIVGFNAGVGVWKGQGLLGYAGQDETVAGRAVGEELNKEGAKNVDLRRSAAGRGSARSALQWHQGHLQRQDRRCFTSPVTTCPQ